MQPKTEQNHLLDLTSTFLHVPATQMQSRVLHRGGGADLVSRLDYGQVRTIGATTRVWWGSGSGGWAERYLELGGFHGDGDADEEDAEHGDGGVAAPVHGPAVGPARHAPHLLPEVAPSSAVAAMVAAHLRRRCECSSGFGSPRSGSRVRVSA
jgi:hypothetical protein